MLAVNQSYKNCFITISSAIHWQTIFGVMGILGGVFCLLLPETSGVDLLSTFDQAEEFYKNGMGISRLLGKTGTPGYVAITGNVAQKIT